MRLSRAATAVVFALLAGSVPAVAAQALPQATSIVPPPIVKPTATARGVISDATSGNPIAGACVDLFSGDSWAPRAHACVGADGKYEFAGLPSGISTWITATAAGYPKQWFLNAMSFPAGFALTANEVRQADFALNTSTATLSGLVRRPNGTPAPQARVGLYRVGEGTRFGDFVTGVDGTFSATTVPPGSYQILFGWDNYTSRWYGGTDDRATAALVTFTAGATVDLTFDVLAQNPPMEKIRATVTGTVKLESGAPVSGATVRFRQNPAVVVGEAITAADGTYSIPEQIAASAVYVEVTAPGRPRVFAPNSPMPRTWLLLPIQNPVVNVVIPEHTGTLKGHLNDFDGTTPPGAARLGIFTSLSSTTPMMFIYPGLDGSFEVPNLPVGDIKIEVVNTGRVVQFYPLAKDYAGAAPVTVQDGQTTDVTITLVAPTYLAATVVDGATGAPIPGACVNGQCAGADGVALYGPVWTLDSLYTTNYLAVTGGHTHWPSNSSFILNRGQVTTTQVALQPAAAISIPISNVSAVGGEGYVCVRVFRLHLNPGGEESACEKSADGQSVILGPFSPGPGQVLIDPSGSFGAQWLTTHGGSGRRDEAALLDLRAGSVTLAPSTTLDPGGTIRGHILSQGGEGISGACWHLTGNSLSNCTDSTGAFEMLGLGPYAWPAVFTGPGYALQWSGGAPDSRGATGIPVPPGGTTDIEVRLKPFGGQLTGFDAFAGDPISYLFAYDAWSGDFLSQSDMSTIHPIEGFNTGRVILGYRNSSGDCWLYQKTALGFMSPYFSTRQGIVVKTQNVTCLKTEPALLREVPRHGMPPEARTVLPRRTVADLSSPSVARMPFGRWVQERLAELMP